MLRKPLTLLLALVLLTTASLAQRRQDARSTKPATFDAVIRGGTVYDGTGGSPKRVDVGFPIGARHAILPAWQLVVSSAHATRSSSGS